MFAKDDETLPELNMRTNVPLSNINLFNNNNHNNKKTSLAPISSENPSSVAQQNQRIRHSRNHVQCKKSSTDGWRCQEAKEDRPL